MLRCVFKSVTVFCMCVLVCVWLYCLCLIHLYMCCLHSMVCGFKYSLGDGGEVVVTSSRSYDPQFKGRNEGVV